MANQPSTGGPTLGPSATAQATSANSENPSGSKESKETLDSTSKIWDSERQIVKSLWKLQELEAKIHQLRTLLPDRLLAPLIPIVNPQKAGPGRPVPKTPEILCEQLSQAVRDGVAEVEEFKAMWQSPEMKVIWDRLEEKMKECDGDYPQPTGVWERDYNVLLEELDKEERIKEERRQKDAEEQERLRARLAEGGWKGIVESFRQKGLPGVRILLSKNETVITVVLLKAGMAFDIQEVDGQDGKGASEWRVSNKQYPGKPKTKLETGILICLNSRPRKWDLEYLLDMICSYSEVKQTRCVKCDKMTDNTAQLPTIRRPKTIESPDGKKILSWEAYHQDCA
ncbi:mediator complex subunit 27-domain-containing protein [Thermoascus aurantiacus ATCC 26904]